MERTLLVILVFIALAYSIVSGATTLCVTDDRCPIKHQVCDRCITANDFEIGPDEIHDNETTKIIFYCQKIILNDTVFFTNMSNFSVEGALYDNTKLLCVGNLRAGFSFIGIDTLVLKNLQLIGCGAMHNSTSRNVTDRNATLNFPSSIYILNCNSVQLTAVTVINGTGTGVVIYDSSKSVEITDCHFENNLHYSERQLPGGGGLYIEFTYCPPDKSAECKHATSETPLSGTYSIVNCTFTGNVAGTIRGEETSHIRAAGVDYQGLGRGGGLNLAFKGGTKNKTVLIKDCNFIENEAVWGGGLWIAFQDSPSDNTIIVEHSEFDGNICKSNGGGGLDVGFLFYQMPAPMRNSIQFSNCTFTSNEAKYGGGTNIYSSPSNFTDLKNHINFIGCTWTGNRAQYGSAVDIASHVWDTLSIGYLPSPKFVDCSFVKNFVIDDTEYSSDSFTHYTQGGGSFFSEGFTIVFGSKTLFEQNNASAMYLISSIAKFQPESNIEFRNNTGFNGAAIVLLGFSALYINDNSKFKFIENKAMNRAGAIYYQSYNKHDYVASRSCFIQYRGNKKVHENFVQLLFVNNTADYTIGSSNGTYGNSVFATTILPCLQGCLDNSEAVFGCVGDVTFNDSNETQHEIATYGNHMINEVNAVFPFKVIPGKRVKLPVSMVDDLNNSVNGLYRISIRSNSYMVSISTTYKYNINKEVIFHGIPGNKATVQIEAAGTRPIAASFEVELQECPPGYIRNGSSSSTTCVCSATASTVPLVYKCIYKCDDQSFQAYIKRGFWIGYEEIEGRSSYKLASAYCPKGFCFSNESISNILLPESASKEDLDDFVCGLYRTGKLCGECTKSASTFYHNNYNCSPNKNCQWGWLLYILSELLPVTILFVVVSFFNISFTNGSVNGAIFFGQMVDTLLPSGGNFIHFPHNTFVFIKIYRLIYRMLNLDFFSIEELSFCLFHGASALDVLAFKYITIVYSLFLVLLTVLLMKVCNLRGLCRLRKFQGTTGSILHGLSTFFVLCYSQCTKVSLLILTPGTVHVDINGYKPSKVVYYNGELQFFHGKHLLYALPALLFTIVIVLIPPVLLVVYPLCYRIFAALRIGESRVVYLACKIIPLEKLRPLFDCFQSCFKDKFRYFAGLYFLYRLSGLAVFVFSSSLTVFYTVVQVQLTLMLGVHALVQPYKEQRHNALDALFFSTLAVINGMTLYMYVRSANTFDHEEHIATVGAIQTALIFLPLVCVMVFVIVKGIHKSKQLLLGKKSLSPAAHQGNIEKQGHLKTSIHDGDRDRFMSITEMFDYQPLQNTCVSY